MPGKWHHCQVWWTGHGCLARCSPPRGAVQWSDAVTCWTCFCAHTYWDRLLYRYCMYVHTYIHVQGSGVLECATCLLVCVVCVLHVLMFHCTICLPTSTCRCVHSVCSVYIESVCSCSWQWWKPACPSLFWQDNGCHGMHHPVALATQDWSSLQEGSQCEDDWLSASCGKGKGNDAKGFRHQGVYKCVRLCAFVHACVRACMRVWFMCVPVPNVLAHKLSRVHQLQCVLWLLRTCYCMCLACMLWYVTYIHGYGDVLFCLWCSHLLHTQSMRVTLKMDIPHNEHSHIIGVRGKTVRQGQENV